MVLSAFALLVSIATLYLTFLRKKAGLVGCLLTMTAPEIGSAEAWGFEFAFANTGDVELLVREVDLAVQTDGFVPELSSDALPFVLEPGRVRPLALELPNRFCRWVEQDQQRLTFNFHFFSSRGTQYVSRMSVTLGADGPDASKANFAPFTLGRVVR
ncbi:MAG: hypothetical protein BGP23_14185 [Lysobacterales bacterium 66-474]|nr:MAG: hypothetical protein ABT18_09830 [Rhodanobacter sp. SCN 66-43]OJY83778.1 MAG: hypothetical protein BGP23_14185 [Xanthomonadales bacterium 66-474]